MKRSIILTLALVLTLSLVACGRLAGVSQNTDDPVSESPVNSPETDDPVSESPVSSPETENPVSESPVYNPEPMNSEYLIGLWHSDNVVGSGYSERYAFNEGGTFIYGTSQMDEYNRQLYATGVWSIENGNLKLEVDARLVEPLEKIEDMVPSDELIILDWGVVKKIYNPPEVEFFSLAETGRDPETDMNTIAIGGVTYYDYNHQTNMFDAYYDLINSGDND